uniref:VP2 n=1 Tax=Bulbitermes polycipivirus TaxID=3032211 RepID=A0AAT9JGX3_9VIRU
MYRAQQQWNNNVGPAAGGYSNRQALNMNSKDAYMGSRIYGMNNKSVGTIDLSKPSRLMETFQHAKFFNSALQGGKEFTRATQDSTIGNSRAGLGNAMRPTMNNVAGGAIRNMLSRNSGQAETSFSTTKQVPQSDRNLFRDASDVKDTYARFVQSGGRDFTSTSPHNDMDWDYYETPDYKSLGEQGTQTTSTYSATHGTQTPRPAMVNRGTDAQKGGPIQRTMAPSVPSTSRSPADITSDFQKAGGMDFTGLASTAVQAGTPSLPVGGASTSAASAMSGEAGGPWGMAAQKVSDIGKGVKEIWDAREAAAHQNDMNEISNRSGMHSGLHANKFEGNYQAYKGTRESFSNMGNTLLGIPGMIGGYMLGDYLGKQQANKDTYATANSARGKIDPQQTKVVNSMSDRFYNGNAGSEYDSYMDRASRDAQTNAKNAWSWLTPFFGGPALSSPGMAKANSASTSEAKQGTSISQNSSIQGQSARMIANGEVSRALNTNEQETSV